MTSATPHLPPGHFVPELINLLAEAIPAGRAVSATALAVDPAHYQTGRGLVSERRYVDALIRRHWDRCRDLELFDGTCEIAFHPDTGVPQIYASEATTSASYSAIEQAMEMLGALITDRWCHGEAPLAIETWMTLLTGDEATDSFDPKLLRQSATLTGGLLEQSHYLILCLALLTRMSPDEVLRRFALMDRGPLDELLGPNPDDEAVKAAYSHVMAIFSRNHKLGDE